MSNENTGIGSCRNICWIVAAILGLLVLWLLSARYGMGLFLALILGVIVGLGIGWLLTRYFCVASDADAGGGTMTGSDPAAGIAASSSVAAEAPSPAPEPEPAPEPARAAAAPEPAPAASPVAERFGDYDGDGVVEGLDEGTRPAGLEGPRGGVADDLKKIKGVGPKLEALLNSLGFWHFDQVSSWNADEVAWVDANLMLFRGRVSRDNWVEQARTLAAGGETEFSKKVDKGDVY